MKWIFKKQNIKLHSKESRKILKDFLQNCNYSKLKKWRVDNSKLKKWHMDNSKM